MVKFETLMKNQDNHKFLDMLASNIYDINEFEIDIIAEKLNEIL